MQPIDLTSVDAKIDRAKQHVAEFERIREEFLATDPFALGAHYFEDRDLTVYTLHETVQIPVHFNTVIGDVVHCLRTALDYLANELVRWGGDQPGKEPGQVYFPIAKTEAEYRDKAARQTRGMSDKIVGFLDQFKPYREGTTLLWIIHELDRIDKHRILTTVGTTFGAITFKFHVEREQVRLYVEERPYEGGDLLFSIRGNTIGNGIEVKFDVAFDEKDIKEIHGRTVLEDLNQMVRVVEKVVECFRLNASELDALTHTG